MSLQKDGFYFIPLGGSEQFGVNFNAYHYLDQWLIIDCGIGFASERYPGIDILLPDPKFLETKKNKIAGMIITHAHEDHVGAVPYLWPKLECPIFCTEFTATILKKKIEEYPAAQDAVINIVKPYDVVELGPFQAKFIPVPHSVPNTCSIILKTKLGSVVHSGDWNLDPCPVIGGPIDPQPFIEARKQGVLAYVGDSTNAEVPGVSGSEKDVEAGLEDLFKSRSGRIIITIFSSNVGRIRSISRAAKKSGRSVGLIGRSLHKMAGAAQVCGYLDDIPDFISEEEIGYLPNEKIVLIATGSQGEQRAQLARMARGDHPEVSLKKGDCVVYSSRAIPGNEKDIIAVNNNLAATGVDIITPKTADEIIHVSGHPCRSEIEKMFEWLKPETVIAVHGERTMLEAHASLAKDCGVKNTIVPINGAVIQLAPGIPEIVDYIESGLLAVEPGRIIEADCSAINERRKLQYSGTIYITLVMNARGDLVSDIKISSVGLYDGEDAQKFEKEIQDEIKDILADLSQEELCDDNFISEEIRIGARRFVYHFLKIKPKTTVHVVRV